MKLASDFLVRGHRLLRLYSYYSLFLALLLILVNSFETGRAIIGSQHATLFSITVAVYVFCTSVFVVVASRNPDVELATSYAFIETALLAQLMFASGGLESGFSSLLLIPVVIANLLAPGILGFAVAAWTALAVLFWQHVFPERYHTPDLISAGIYGFLCFLLASLTQALSRRLNSALQLASQQTQRFKRLQKLSRQALIELPYGLIACDRSQRILFANEVALRHFELQEGFALPDYLINQQSPYVIEHDHQRWTVRRQPLNDHSGDALLLIEDNAHIAAHAQQLKLASLGQLSASIAHEIRNPLSAMRHAAQLLAETPYLANSERQLTSMIEQHSMRINRTIEDMLQLARRRPTEVGAVMLHDWLQRFENGFIAQHGTSALRFTRHCDPSLCIHFDPHQLQQVMDNVCSNGLRYASLAHPHEPRITVTARALSNRRVQIDVTDNGEGISKEQQAHLFEPFFTTEPTGTGLGLYLCRELCEANHANIHYHLSSQGSCFRIIANHAATDSLFPVTQ